MKVKVFSVSTEIVGPRTPRKKTVRARRVGDYPTVSAAHLDVAKKLSNPLLMGPPICDELIAFIQHLFTEEEASAVRRLSGFGGRTALAVARAEHRPVNEVEPILQRIAFEKYAIASHGPAGHEKYQLTPVMPGIFEMVLFGVTPEKMTDWHRRFAQLFEALYETGYSADYGEYPAPFVRFLPLDHIGRTHPMALPSDKLEVVLDRYKVFAVGQCQCRMTMNILGKGCGRPLGNCAVMGDWAKQSIERGVARQVSKEEMLAIKMEAEKLGMVSWIMNVESSRGQVSCTCCGCCCHAMRQVNEFNVPSMAAPPHFLPRLDANRCTHCGKCARLCPMGALNVKLKEKTWEHRIARCIGCGLCAAACDRLAAISMEPVPNYRLPPKSWFALITRSIPNILRNSWHAWREHRP